jgi:single-strand DNA-binding protein
MGGDEGGSPSRGASGSRGPAAAPAPASKPAAKSGSGFDDMDDDIPF